MKRPRRRCSAVDCARRLAGPEEGLVVASRPLEHAGRLEHVARDPDLDVVGSQLNCDLGQVRFAKLPDEQAMAEFVTLIPEGGGRSFFNDIRVVEPGHLVTVTRDATRSRRYWNPSPSEVALPAGADFVEGLRHHLDQATLARLRGANGTVASHLSAGFDSAAVTATAARLLARRPILASA